MMSDEEDVAAQLVLESDLDSESGDSDSQEVQDEIVPRKRAFPSLELDDEDGAEDVALYFSANTPVKKAKAGTFGAFGLSRTILANVTKKGYRQPTPIQRKTIPLIVEGRDVVGMARTGSGKTAAFVLPLIEKLKSHTAKVGVRAVILSPLRELALQTYKQVKDFSKGTDLRSIVLIGGDSLEEQFTSMTANPDIIVATPGRFLHLKVEMQLDLGTVEYVVFDEADRLFEMGFAEQLNELLGSLPASRQLLLFSATLPRSLVDFAKAGLTNPVLVRLDAETKLSENLQMAFFSTKKTEREASLLFLVQEVLKIPQPTPPELARWNEANKYDSDDEKPRRREKLPAANVLPSKHSTIVFVPTKHHVEYLTGMLREAGFLVAYIYGSLDQHARREQLRRFRLGLAPLLVVTDVAARGIDIPVLANVVNYTLPALSKIFIHRVGRTARAGNKGWAYSLVDQSELPYLLDLELFLGKKILLTTMHEKKCELLRDKGIEAKVSYVDRLVLGGVPRSRLESYGEMVLTMLSNSFELQTIRDVSLKGERLYNRTRPAASLESVRRTKEILESGFDDPHLLLGPNADREKEQFLAKLQNRHTKETVFEFLKKGHEKENDSLVKLMGRRRKQIAPIQKYREERRAVLEKERMAGLARSVHDELRGENEVGYNVVNKSMDNEELEAAFKPLFRDPQFYMSHHAPATGDDELEVGSFSNDAAAATYDLENDDKMQKNTQVVRWDKKKGRYINSNDGKKYIIGEGGQRIPALYRLGKFDQWMKERKLSNVRQVLLKNDASAIAGKKFRHKLVAAPKTPDKFRDDFHKQRKRVGKALESGVAVKGYARASEELRSTSQIRKNRETKNKRREKNGRK